MVNKYLRHEIDMKSLKAKTEIILELLFCSRKKLLSVALIFFFFFMLFLTPIKVAVILNSILLKKIFFKGYFSIAFSKENEREGGR